MKSGILGSRLRCLWATAVFGALAYLAGPVSLWAGQDLQAIPPEAWASIGPQIERAVYAFDESGQACNQTQDFTIAAEQAGLVINGRLRLRALTLNGDPLPKAEPCISRSRVEYDRGPVTEWYENRSEGLEQGFTIHGVQGSGAGVQLALDVAFETEMGVEIVEDGQAVVLTDSHGAARYRYAQLKVKDAAGQPLECCFQTASVNSAAPIVRILCDIAGARFPIAIDPILTGMETKLVASDWVCCEKYGFGFSVSLDGDVALVGAYTADAGGIAGAGAAYVYERHAGGTNAWGEVAKLTVPDGAVQNYFGRAVSVAGDVAVVGADGVDPGGITKAGAAYVFERNAGGTNRWGQVAMLTAPDRQEYAEFGMSVSVAGDVALVGARGATPGGIAGAGAAYVFERNAGGTNAWGWVATLNAPNGIENAQFGFSVSIAGDVALVGERFSNPGGGYMSSNETRGERTPGAKWRNYRCPPRRTSFRNSARRSARPGL